MIYYKYHISIYIDGTKQPNVNPVNKLVWPEGKPGTRPHLLYPLYTVNGGIKSIAQYKSSSSTKSIVDYGDGL